MDFSHFVTYPDYYNKELIDIPVYKGCAELTCNCGNCNIPVGHINRLQLTEFIENLKSTSQFLEENMKPV